MKTRVTLIRHGETSWNKIGKIQGISDIPLNETGIQQAKEKAVILPNTYTRAISSPLERAEKTLHILLKEKALKIPIHTDAAFVERNFGMYEGGNSQYFREHQRKQVLDATYETNEQLEHRVIQGLSKVVTTYPEDELLIAAHSHVLKATLVAIDNETFDYYPLMLKNLATIVIEYNHTNNTWCVLSHETYTE